MSTQSKNNESNSSPYGNLSGWTYSTVVGHRVQGGLEQIPSDIYPNNPGNESFYPTGTTGVWNFFTKYILPILPIISLAGMWANTWSNAKRYYYAENKNYENTLDLTVNALTTAASTVFWSFLIFGSTALAIYAAPYILVSIFGLGMSYGLFNVIKHIVYACTAETSKERNFHLKAIPLQLLNTAISTLGFVTNLIFGFQILPKLDKAYHLFQDSLDEWDFQKFASAMVLAKDAGELFRGVKSIYYAFTALLTLGAAASAWKTNKETLTFLQNPGLSFKSFLEQWSKKVDSLINYVTPYSLPIRALLVLLLVSVVTVYVAFEILSGAAELLARVASLVVLPLQFLYHSVFGGSISTPAPVKNPIRLSNHENGSEQKEEKISSTRQVALQLSNKQEREFIRLQQKTDAHIAKLTSELAVAPNEKRQQKLAYLNAVKTNKLSNSAQTFNRHTNLDNLAELTGPKVFQSFWKAKGKGGVERIRDDIKKYEQKWLPQAQAEPRSDMRASI